MSTAGRVVGYLRVSTANQALEGVSLAAQEEKIRAWHGLYGEGRELVIERDEGLSGSSLDRPGLESALDLCHRGGVLVVYSMSRLSRSTADTCALAQRLEKMGCDLVSLSERIDTTSAGGRMIFRMMAVFAEYERELIAERTSAALRHLMRGGHRVSRYAPTPAVVADSIAEMRTAGLSLRQIGRALEAQGIPTTAGGTRWSAKLVRAVLLRRAESK